MILLSGDPTQYTPYHPIFYNDVYAFDPAQATAKWKMVSGDRTYVSSPATDQYDLSNAFHLANLPYPNSFHGDNQPGGIMSPIYWDNEGYLMIFGGVGYGLTTEDHYPSVRDEPASFHCFYIHNGGTGVSNSNSSCTPLDDLWVYNRDINSWRHVSGSLNPQLFDTGVYTDKNQMSSTARPRGRAFGGGFKSHNRTILFGGGLNSYFIPSSSSRVSMEDIWYVGLPQCNDKLFFFSDVCNGHGNCTTTDVCVCESDWGDDSDYCAFPISNGIKAGNPGVCNNTGNCTSPGVCLCSSGDVDYDDFCEFAFCDGLKSTDNLVCNGHGNCTSNGVCECDDATADPLDFCSSSSITLKISGLVLLLIVLILF